ncbi:MAG: MBL fold metallo-hydrolase [Dehalococcoidia bacterium]
MDAALHRHWRIQSLVAARTARPTFRRGRCTPTSTAATLCSGRTTPTARPAGSTAKGTSGASTTPASSWKAKASGCSWTSASAWDRTRGTRAFAASLLERMSDAGFEPGSVTQVFLTHAHPDHVGWAFDEERGVPRFPNARYRLHRKDWHFFADRETVPKHFTRFVEPLAKSGALDMLDGEADIAPGVTALETPGHTAGHMSLLIRSRGEGLVIAGDVLNSPMYVTEPHRPFGSDADQKLGIETRVRLVERIAAEGWHVGAAHFRTRGGARWSLRVGAAGGAAGEGILDPTVREVRTRLSAMPRSPGFGPCGRRLGLACG